MAAKTVTTSFIGTIPVLIFENTALGSYFAIVFESAEDLQKQQTELKKLRYLQNFTATDSRVVSRGEQ